MSDVKFHKFEKTDGRCRITLARPKHNVFNIDMLKEFNGLMEKCLDDNDLKCVVIDAEGPSFCAGVEVGDHKPGMADEMIAVFSRMFELIYQLEIPVIAAVQGACLGGGMELAIACDIIVAAQKAVFGQPEIKLGFFPPYAAVRLPELIGPAKAIEVCTTGKRYSAREAKDMGFVAYVVEDDELNGVVDAIVKEIDACSPLIIRLNKRAVRNHLGMDFKTAMDGVNDLFLSVLMKTEDTLEGLNSFDEKRKPEWKNK